MKKIISFLLVISMFLCVFASCSKTDNSNSQNQTESTTNPNTEIITIVSRNNQEPLEIVYNKFILSATEAYSSEVRFCVSAYTASSVYKAWQENVNKKFSVLFVSGVTAKEDYSATLGDGSIVTKFSELEKCILGNGKMVFYYDEFWYEEFTTRYYYYENNGDLIKFTFKEQISDESISFILSLFEFK